MTASKFMSVDGPIQVLLCILKELLDVLPPLKYCTVESVSDYSLGYCIESVMNNMTWMPANELKDSISFVLTKSSS